MTLQGDLREFGVAEVFQLLERQSKTGCLLLSIADQEMEIYFQNGKIVGAIEKGREHAKELLDVLSNMGILTGQEKVMVQQQHEQELRGLREILEQRQIMEGGEIDAVMEEQVQRRLFHALSCGKGNFLFDANRALVSEWVLREPMAVEPVILEGLRQRDEWPLLRRRIHSYQDVPRRQVLPEGNERSTLRRWVHHVLFRPGKREGDSQEGMEWDPRQGEAEEVCLSSAERTVYNLVDGENSVEAIVRGSPLGEYTTCKALLDLVERGWLRFDRPTDIQERPVVVAHRRGLRTGLFAVGGLIVVLVVALLLVSRGRFPLIQESVGKGAAAACRLLNIQQRSRVSEAIHVYREEYGRVPEQLSDLTRVRLLDKDDLSLWGANEFVYTVESGQEYSLLIRPRL